MKKNSKNNQNGQSLITVLVFSVIAMSVATAAVAIMVNLAQGTTRLEGNIIAQQTAESGVENALLRLLRNPGYTGETLPVGDGLVVVTVTGSNQKTITAVATTNSYTKTVQTVAEFVNGVMSVISWQEL